MTELVVQYVFDIGRYHFFLRIFKPIKINYENETINTKVELIIYDVETKQKVTFDSNLEALLAIFKDIITAIKLELEEQLEKKTRPSEKETILNIIRRLKDIAILINDLIF